MKINLRINFLIFLTIILHSCAVEEDLPKARTQTDVTSKLITFDEFKLINKDAGLLRNTSTNLEQITGRPSHSKNYDFIVDTDKILMTEKDGYRSFSFPVEREKQISSGLENLFLHPYSDGYLAYLVTYDFSPEDLSNLDNGLPISDLIEKATFKLLENPDINDIGVNYASYASRGGYSGTVISYNGGCWTVNNVFNDPDTGELMYTLIQCPGCACGNTSGGQGPTTGSGPGFSHALCLALVDLGYGSSGGPVAAGGGPSGGGGNPIPWNPFNPPLSTTNPPRVTPALGHENPILGVVSQNIDVSPEMIFYRSLTQVGKAFWNNPSNSSLKNRIIEYIATGTDLERIDNCRKIVEMCINNNDIQYGSQLLSFLSVNGGTIDFDNTLDSSNALLFDTFQDFENYIIPTPDTPEIEYAENQQQQQKVATAKFKVGITFNLEVDVKQKLLPWQLLGVNSEIFGFTFGNEWEQLDEDGDGEQDYVVNHNGNFVTIEIMGVLRTRLKVGDLLDGTIYSNKIHVKIVINKTTGNIVGTHWL